MAENLPMYISIEPKKSSIVFNLNSEMFSQFVAIGFFLELLY